MGFEDFKYRLPTQFRSRLKPQTIKVWAFAVKWIAEHGESDCFDRAALKSLNDDFGIRTTRRRWAEHLRAMERAGLLRGHRIVTSIESVKFGRELLFGVVSPGAYVAYTLPGMIALGRDQAFLASHRVIRKSPP